MLQNDILYLALLWFIQAILLVIQVFRFNIIFSVASFVTSWAMSNVTGVPLYLNWADWLVGWAQFLAGILILIFGKKSVDHTHLG